MRNFRQGRGSDRSGGNRGSGRRDSHPREMFKTHCDQCHKECQVPFKPSSGKPVYCDNCFRINKGSGDRPERRERGSRDFSQRTMYKATCDTCGNSCEIPFQPRGDKPVYCSDCFSKEKTGKGNDNFQGQLREVNEKLDKILRAVTKVTYVDAKGTKDEAVIISETKKTTDKKTVAKKAASKKTSQKSAAKKSPAKKKK